MSAKKEPKFERHPMAIAWDKWEESEDAKGCLRGMTSGQYLRNRLKMAFMAGYDAMEKHILAANEKTLRDKPGEGGK